MVMATSKVKEIDNGKITRNLSKIEMKFVLMTKDYKTNNRIKGKAIMVTNIKIVSDN